jgi:hypothetical protein
MCDVIAGEAGGEDIQKLSYQFFYKSKTVGIKSTKKFF